jgi:ubiquinone/menaquinone biosynthesis C-methylase UbiE
MVNWDEKAKEFGDSEYGAHTDKYLVMLENEFIGRHLAHIKPNTILDVGCGNGRRTLRWSKQTTNAQRLLDTRHGETLGIDDSQEMIEIAKEVQNGYNPYFIKKNVKNIDDLKVGWDVIVSARCLINLGSWEEQISTIDKIYELLMPGGWFICCEGREMGTQQLNRVRKLVGIDEIAVIKGNIDLDEDVIRHIRNKFMQVDADSLGLYYFITRVLTQVDQKTDMKEIAMKLQLNKKLIINTMGRHFCFCGQKPF